MKKFKLNQLIACLLVVSSVLALNPIKANAEWKENDIGWWYEENDSYYTGWQNIDNKWYYFDSDGYMEHDTVIDGYKLGSDGAWITDEGGLVEKDANDIDNGMESTYLQAQ